MRWSPTRALRRAVLVTGLFAAAGVVLGRPDVVLLAAPFALGAAWALRRRPAQTPEVSLALGNDRVVEGGEASAVIEVANPGWHPLDVVVLRARPAPWLALAGADRPHVVVVPPWQVAELALVGTARRWGRHRLGPARATAYAADGLLRADPPATEPVLLSAYPATAAFSAGEAMPRASGRLGTHRSRRPGQGGELAGVRQFLPGDRLRRVDWRVSLRTRIPHVAATLSDRDAELVLVLDVLSEVGRSGGVDGRASVLDITVRASAGIAEHYLHRGDRVSLVEYGQAARRLRPGSGRRQYLTALEWLLDLRPGAGLGEPYHRVFGLHRFGPDALVVVLTPLVEPEAASMLARLARAGRYVVAVDTLPPDLPPPPELGGNAKLAYRLWRLERENTLGALREHGVPIVPWAGAGSLDHVLRQVSRMPARRGGQLGPTPEVSR